MRNTGRNPSDVLGVPEDAPFSEVKRAYLRRARATHPDTPGGSAEAFRQVQAAFEALRACAPRTAAPTRPSPYDRWTGPSSRPARQWIDADPLIARYCTPAPAQPPTRPPAFSDVLSAELRRLTA